MNLPMFTLTVPSAEVSRPPGSSLNRSWSQTPPPKVSTSEKLVWEVELPRSVRSGPQLGDGWSQTNCLAVPREALVCAPQQGRRGGTALVPVATKFLLPEFTPMISPQFQSHSPSCELRGPHHLDTEISAVPLRVTHPPCKNAIPSFLDSGWRKQDLLCGMPGPFFKVWLRSVLPSPLYQATGLSKACNPAYPCTSGKRPQRQPTPLSTSECPPPWFLCPRGPQSPSTSCFSSPSSSLLQFTELLLHARHPSAIITYYHSPFIDGDTEVTCVEGRSEACLYCSYVFKWQDF